MDPLHEILPPGTPVILYARKSTEEGQEASIDTQTRGGTRLSEEMSWPIAEVVIDDGVSRAEFQKRLGLKRVKGLAEANVGKAVLVRDSSRMGGDMVRTALYLQDLMDAGCRVVYYSTREIVKLDTSQDRLLVSIRGYADEVEREKIADRTAEGLRERALQGLAVNQAPYGYAHEAIVGSSKKRVIVNEVEAAVVRRIFTLYSNGEGARAIARILNDAGVLPNKRRGRAAATKWEPSVVQAFLSNRRYIGEYEHGRIESTYKGGTKVRTSRAVGSSKRVVCPFPRIIDAALWDAVQARVAKKHRVPKKGEKRTDSNKKGAKAKYLLTGNIKCGVCGGSLTSGDAGRYLRCRSAFAYAGHGCTNKACFSAKPIQAKLLEELQGLVTEKFVDAFVSGLRTQLTEKVAASTAQQPALEKEAAKLRKELDKISDLLISTDHSQTLVDKYKGKEARLREVEHQLTVAPAAQKLVTETLADMETRARALVADLPALLAGKVEGGRKVLAAVLPEPLKAHPDGTVTGHAGLASFVATGNLNSNGTRAAPVTVEIGEILDVSTLPTVPIRIAA